MILLASAWLCGALLPGYPTFSLPGAPITVTVVVTNLPSNKATLKVYFYNVKDNFLVRNHYTVLKHLKPGGNNRVEYAIPLLPGEWAIAVTQDLNENDLVDHNLLGIPTEPFAFSNNVHPRFKAPRFDDCKFTVRGTATSVAISMK